MTNSKNNLNNNIYKFISGLSNDNYNTMASLSRIDEVAVSVNLTTSDSGFHVPKTIKIDGLSGIYFLRQDGTLNPEYKAIENENGFDLLEMNMNTWNKYELFMSKT